VKPILFDADAFLCVRKISLLRLLEAAPSSQQQWLMTEYVARHELNTVAQEILAFEQRGRLKVEAVAVRGSSAAARFKQLRVDGVDKGEAEAIAWAMGLDPAERPLFISNDRDARAVGRANAVPSGDVMDLVVEMIVSDVAPKDLVREAVAVWDDKRQDLCRPGDYQGFEATYARRLALRP
jgi:predicted nucleic acid-binding protein